MAEALKTARLVGELAPGVQINQESWARRLGVSRAALREGLKVVTAAGFLVHEEHRGYFVGVLSGPEVHQLYWLRIAIEREVVLGTRMPTPEEAELLSSSCGAAVDAFDARQVQECIDAERRFYFAVYDLSSLTFLASEAKRLWDLAAVYRATVAAITNSDERGRKTFRRVRLFQLDAILAGDRYAFAESVVGTRRKTMESFGPLSSSLHDPMPSGAEGSLLPI